MTAITASMVKELREMTGAGMMDAKKALVENDGNIEASVDWLRTRRVLQRPLKRRVARRLRVLYPLQQTTRVHMVLPLR